MTRKYPTLVEKKNLTNELFLGTLDLNPCLNVHCPRYTVHMTLGVSVMTNAPHIKIPYALQMEQHTTTNAGIS